MRIFDSHVHFVDPDRSEGIVWPDTGSRVYGRHMPESLLEASSSFELTGCIAIETSRRSVDDDWLLQLGRDNSLIEGVVLNLQPDTEGFEQRFAPLLKIDEFAGIRLRPIEDYDLESPLLHQNIALLQRERKTIEFGAKTRALKASFAGMARQFSGSTWILDHCGHPEAGRALASEWCDGIAEIAELSNAVCKISSEYSDLDIWEPALEFLLQQFGPNRLMFGSNWPVCTPNADLPRAARQLETFFGEHGHAILEANARRVYGAINGG